MTQVWERSQQAGTDLLVMLALADFSDDQGSSYPAVTTLAAKCRMKPRNMNYILAALVRSGELQIRANEGPKGTNRYRIVIDKLGMQSLAGDGVQGVAGVQSSAGVQPNARPPATQCALPLQHTADEPSLNRQETSSSSSSKKTPPCPVRDLIKLFIDAGTGLPEPKTEFWKKSKAAAAVRARWVWVLTERRDNGERYATTSDEALAWFAKFFARVAASDFLTGRDGQWSGCHLAWLMQPDNFRKVVEGNYTNRQAA